MNISNRIQISGPFNRLFTMASDIARWPDILPHYRWVKILERRYSPPELVAEMAARHKGIPLWWRTIQRPRPEEKRIEFSHIGGITKGMQVQWTFDESGETCLGPTWLVQIHHQFAPAWPPPGQWFADRIVCETFVAQVAAKTLNRIKHLMEGTPS